GGANTQMRGAHRQAGEHHQCRRRLIPAREVMLDQEGRMKAKPFGFDVEVEPFVKAGARLRALRCRVGLRRAEQTETHVRILEYPETAPCRRKCACGQARRSGAAS